MSDRNAQLQDCLDEELLSFALIHPHFGAETLLWLIRELDYTGRAEGKSFENPNCIGTGGLQPTF